MTNAPMPESNEPAHDPEILELAQKIFDLARQGDTSTVAAYVDAGVPANLTDDKGDSLVMLAASHGHADTVRVLLERKADPDRANDEGQTPLAATVVTGGDDMIDALLSGGANPRAGTPSAVETAQSAGKNDLVARFETSPGGAPGEAPGGTSEG